MQIGFEECLLDTDRRELRRGDELVALEPQVFDVLIYLIENRDRVVSKDDLIASVWSGRIVSESTLTSRINAVRKAIGDSGEKQSLIRTFAKKGFRFIAPVDVKNKEAMEPAAPPTPAFGVPTKPSIAVLPFSNMSGEPDQDSFVDGVTEEIITELSRCHWFFLIARRSTFAYKRNAIGPEQIARELGLRYILMGSVRLAGDRIRVTAQLIDANNRRNVWARSYDRAASDIFSVQDEITQTIVGGIEPELSRAERERARVKQRDNLDAWSTYQRGMFHLYRYTQDDLAQARKLFAPSRALAHYGLGAAFVFSGRPRDAFPHLESAIRLSPHDPNMGSYLVRIAEAKYLIGEDDAAVRLALKALAQPGFQWSRYSILIAALGQLGRLEEAQRYLAEVTRARPNFSVAFVRTMHPFARDMEVDRYYEGLRKAGVPEAGS